MANRVTPQATIDKLQDIKYKNRHIVRVITDDPDKDNITLSDQNVDQYYPSDAIQKPRLKELYNSVDANTLKHKVIQERIHNIFEKNVDIQAETDNSPVAFESNSNLEKAKFMNGLKISKNTIDLVNKYSKDYGVDPNIALAALSIEGAHKGTIRSDAFFNTLDLDKKFYERHGLYDVTNVNDLYKNAAISDSASDEIKDRYINRYAKIADSMYAKRNKTYTDGIEPHIKFISENSIDSVNPLQHTDPGVKYTYNDMVGEAAEYIKSQNLFN